MLASNYFPQDDAPLRTVIDSLKLLTGQIQGITGTLYDNPPDAAPTDNTVLYLPMGWTPDTSEIGKLRLVWTIEIQHCFRRGRLQDTYSRVVKFVMPWMRALTAWPNQDLGGIAIETDPTAGKLTGYSYGGTALIAISNTVRVLTEEPLTLS